MNESEQQDIETPVTACGGKINNPSSYPTANYKGKTIYFCIEACLQAFRTDPDGFMAGEVEHPE
jgi:YHS domain-containing protein